MEHNIELLKSLSATLLEWARHLGGLTI